MNISTLIEKRRKANDLRKSGNFKEALLLYRDLWNESEDRYDGAGLLHCLRKLELFDEATNFAAHLIDRFPDFDWVRNEVIWTLISGVLYRFDETQSLEKMLPSAEKVMGLKPDRIATKIVVFKVLKSAKAANDWDTINEWLAKITPNSLGTEPLTDSSGRKGWSEQALWYNYRINCLIRQGDPDQAIALVDEVLKRFPKQGKFFLRLKALALYHLGSFTESEKIYEDLCSRYKSDWWILHEYARVVKDSSRTEDALELMFRAAINQSKLELIVSLLSDIGMLCKDMEMMEEARSHLVLCRFIRERNGWSVPESITTAINTIGDNSKPSSLKEALDLCRNMWIERLGKDRSLEERSYKKRKAKKNLIGRVSLGRSDRPFCFISDKHDESYFCYKSDLPASIDDGIDVIFDAIPSFDKKKNKESWKAVNIRYPQ